MAGILTSVEICAGAGGAALGLEAAGFGHLALVEWNADACATLRANRPRWPVIRGDVTRFDGRPYHGADLLSGGVPCTPFSGAGQQKGADDKRDLFPQALRLAAELEPKVIMLENADTVLAAKFDGYRAGIRGRLLELGYRVGWQVAECADYGVPQRRQRSLLIAMRPEYVAAFRANLPEPTGSPLMVGDALHDLMASRGWPGAGAWRDGAREVAPTLVGGSEKHGGPDLGPTGAKKAWARLGIDGLGIADQAPDADGKYLRGRGTWRDASQLGPMLTVAMGGRLQGFPGDWKFSGGKGAQWGQVGNAFPPPAAKAYGLAIAAALGRRA